MNNIKRVKTAIVGCGMISNIYIRNLKHLFSIIDLCALCNTHRDVAENKAKEYGIERVMTLEEIAADPEIELVVNLTGPGAHYEVIKKMLLAGKHVFSEKTLAVTFAEAKELCQIADEKKLYLGVAPDTILGAGVQTAIKVLQGGLIGEITSVVACINRNQALNSELFTFIQKGEGTAFPYDVGVYYVASLLAICGPVKRVCGMAKPAPEHERELLYTGEYGDKWTLPGNNLMAGSMEFVNGITGTIHFDGNSVNEECHLIRIYGSEGILELGDPNKFGGEVRLIRKESGECLIPHTHGYDGTPTLENPTGYEFSYGNRGIGAAELAWALRMGRKNRCSKELGTHTLELFHGMDEASKSEKYYHMTTDFEFKPLKSGYMSTVFHGGMRGDAEMSLVE